MSRKTELLDIAEQLGMQGLSEQTPTRIKTLVATKLGQIFAQKGIVENAMIQYAANAPAKVAGKKMRVVSVTLRWTGTWPSITLDKPGSLFAAHIVAQYASVVK